MSNAVINVSHLTKSFKNKDALKDITFKVDQGDCVALIGPNGAGKTTLMSSLLGDVIYQKGEISVLELPVDHKDLKSRVTVLFQENVVQRKMKVKELIAFQKSLYDKSLSDQEIKSLLAFSDDQYNQFAEKLSGGQKRLLQFVLILIGQPELIFLDEPTAGMDTSTRQYFWQVIDRLKADGKTIIYSSHYIEEVEHTADRILVLHQGQLIRDTTPYAMRAEEKQKVFTIPITYHPIFEQSELVSNLEVRQDNLTFTTSQPAEVWTVLQEEHCPIDAIEMNNRTLLDSIFLTTEGDNNEIL